MAAVVLVVVASLALGRSLTATGGADILADAFMSVASGLSTPMGYQTNVLIMQPGGYVFRDFLRVGGPLSRPAAPSARSPSR
jgi:di/tricarboxylate transporter